MTNFVYGLLFLLTMMLQTGAVASLPAPYRLFPLGLVVGVILLHERSMLLGVLWIVASGFLLEIRGLGDGLAFAAMVAAATATLLALSVFATRSFWALLGIAAGTAVMYVVARLLWFAGVVVLTPEQIHFSVLIEQGLTTILLMMIGAILFGAYIRRFLRWSRDRFVSKGQLYDISLPQ